MTKTTSSESDSAGQPSTNLPSEGYQETAPTAEVPNTVADASAVPSVSHIPLLKRADGTHSAHVDVAALHRASSQERLKRLLDQ